MKSDPSPIAATIAVAVFGPIPRILAILNFQIWKTIHATADYQFVTDPAFNRDREPVSVFGVRLHWEL